VQVAIKILDKEKIQKQNMGAQIKKEVRVLDDAPAVHEAAAARAMEREPCGASSASDTTAHDPSALVPCYLCATCRSRS